MFHGKSLSCRSESSLERTPGLESDSLHRWIVVSASQLKVVLVFHGESLPYRPETSLERSHILHGEFLLRWIIHFLTSRKILDVSRRVFSLQVGV